MTRRNKNSWVIREAKSDDFDAIRELYRVVWGHNRPIEYDRWKYFNFVAGPSQISIAAVNKDIVSVFMLAPVSLGISSEIVLGGVAMDVMSHPEYRGTAVFVESGKHCVEKAKQRGFRVLYGFPNTNSFPVFIKRLNWDHSGDVNHWVRPIKPSKYSKVPLVLGPVADLATYFLPAGKSGDLTIKVRSELTDEYLPLLDQLRRFDKKCRIDRKENWFCSRYAVETKNNYEWIYAYQGDKILACGVWGMRDKSWGSEFTARAQIVELFGYETRALLGVVSAIIKRAREKEAMLIETITKNSNIENILKSCSFYKHNRIPLIVKNLGPEELPANIHHHPNWTIFGGDVDTF